MTCPFSSMVFLIIYSLESISKKHSFDRAVSCLVFFRCDLEQNYRPRLDVEDWLKDAGAALLEAS